MNRLHYLRGFTLIELMITIALLSVLLVIAVPTFNEFRQRAALRGAADQVATFWGDARFEALRRNQFVKVSIMTSGASYCLGATTVTAADVSGNTTANNAVCDCTAAVSATTCNISRFPTDQSEWRGMTVAAATTLGSDDGGAIVINPKRVNVADPADVGRIFLGTPGSMNANYRLSIDFDRNGRAVICEPAAAANKLPQFTNRRC